MTRNQKLGLYNKKIEDIGEFYNTIAQSYDVDVESIYKGWPDSRECVEALNKIYTNKLDRSSLYIIDIACGTGLTGTELYTNNYLNIDGFDASDKMILEATSKNVYKHLQVSILNENLSDLLLNRYDVATCTGAIAKKHIEPEYVPFIFNIIRPNGYFIFGLRSDHINHYKIFDELEAKGICKKLDKIPFVKFPGAGPSDNNYIRRVPSFICVYQRLK